MRMKLSVVDGFRAAEIRGERCRRGAVSVVLEVFRSRMACAMRASAEYPLRVPRVCGDDPSRTYWTYFLARYARTLRNGQDHRSASVAADRSLRRHWDHQMFPAPGGEPLPGAMFCGHIVGVLHGRG